MFHSRGVDCLEKVARRRWPEILGHQRRSICSTSGNTISMPPNMDE